MDSILQQITDWLKEMLVSAIMGNLSGMFESVNNQVGEIATSVGMTPANFSPGVFAMVRNISESVIIPIAGLILTFIACYELIQMIIDHNNLANFETWIFFKWVFKTFVAVMLITNTCNQSLRKRLECWSFDRKRFDGRMRHYPEKLCQTGRFDFLPRHL